MSLDLYIYFMILIMVALNGLVRFNRLSIPFKALAVLLTVVLVSEVVARILAIRIRNSYPPYHILCVMQYWIYAYIYYKLLQNKVVAIYVIRSIVPFMALSILNTVFFQHLLEFPSNMIMLSYIIFIGLSLLLFTQMLREPEQTAISKQGVFWFNCAVLIYSAAIPVCFGVLNYLIRHNYHTEFLQDFIEYLSFLYYLTLGLATYLDATKVIPQND